MTDADGIVTLARRARLLLPALLCVAAFFFPCVTAAHAHSRLQSESRTADGVSILAYHRFATEAGDAMTVRVSTFRWQLDYLARNGYPVIPLRRYVDYLRGRAPAPPPHSVVLTADDGHASVFTDMLPIVREYGVPVTLFVYPSAISNASYAMTWEQLASLAGTGLFDVESHTYWHPNFNIERRRLAPDAYRAFVTMQLRSPRTVLRERLGASADFIAWPFGIYDEELLALAEQEGYVAGFTLARRVVTSSDRIMALPRFLMTDSLTGSKFAAVLPR